jgi:hypothetical protein
VRQLVIPWLATFLLGCAVFVVGRILQTSEKRKREAVKAAKEREEFLARRLAQVHAQNERPEGIMAAMRDQGQRTEKYVN